MVRRSRGAAPYGTGVPPTRLAERQNPSKSYPSTPLCSFRVTANSQYVPPAAYRLCPIHVPAMTAAGGGRSRPPSHTLRRRLDVLLHPCHAVLVVKQKGLDALRQENLTTDRQAHSTAPVEDHPAPAHGTEREERVGCRWMAGFGLRGWSIQLSGWNPPHPPKRLN